MLAALSLALSVLTLAIAAGLLTLLYRARGARAELARSLHDKALGLDRRCDVLQRRLDRLAERQRIDHLLDLVSCSRRQGRLDDGAALRLERYVLDLREEVRRTAEAG